MKYSRTKTPALLVSFSAGLSALLAMSSAAQAQDLDALIATCDGCHGTDGVSQWSDVPTIAGIDEFVHSDALYMYQDEARPCASSSFRQGDTERPDTTMCEISAELSDAQIEAIAAHYAELPFVAAQQDFDPALAQAGAVVHENECARCHSDGGSNPEDEASILAGQQMGYLESTFAEYRSGAREQPKKMQEKLEPLSDDDIEALIHYYASQQ